MKKFLYVATDAKKNPVTGTIEQNDRSSVIAALTKQGLRPISIKEAPAVKAMGLGNLSFLTSNRVKSDVLVMFTRQLSAMISAGVPLVRALNSLGTHTESPALQKVLEEVIRSVEGGSSLADALGKHDTAFSDVYVNMVRAGESAGILDDILKRLAFQQEKNATIRKKVRSAMAYPIVLLVIMFIAFFGLMLFIIPQIGGILTSLGGPDAKLPTITLVMLGISGFITHAWFIILPVLGGAIYGASRYVKTPEGKLRFHTLLLNIPGLKTIIIKLAVARFARTFSALMGAGVPVLECLTVTGRAIGNLVYENTLANAAKQVTNGKSLSSVLSDTPLFPPIVSQMLAVGEETGQTDLVLVKVADFYEEEVDVAIESLSSIIEPVMIVFMGGMVGLIAASVMVPIANLSQSIK